jgi:hypothetical protein
MRRVFTQSKAIGLLTSLAVGLCGLGCVNLDKPADVTACASNNTCFNGEKQDAAVSRNDGASDSDITRDSTLPPADARFEGDSVATSDGVSAGGAEVGPSNGTEVGADTATHLLDAGMLDSRVGDDTAPDVAPSPDVSLADAPKDALGSDTAAAVVADTAAAAVADTAAAAVADTNPPPMDTGPNNVVTFDLGKGVGAMTGYGWAAPGSADSISSPTCAAGTAITAANPCLSQTNWGTANPTALCVTGSIPSTTTSPDTSANWGIQVGVNASDPDSSSIGRPFTTVAVSASGVPTGDVRIEIHRSGDDPGITYCASWTNSATPVPLTSFNTACWDLTGTKGTKLTATDVPNIDKVGLQVSPSKTADITLTNLCLHSITFAN